MVTLEHMRVDGSALAAFCRRWRVTELALFGSVARGEARPESDVDLLIGFAPGVAWTLLDHARMEAELTQLFGRKVDLVSKRAIEQSANWIRRAAILDGVVPLHVAG